MALGSNGARFARAAIVWLVLAVALCGGSAAMAQTELQHSYVGHWKLDKERSDSPSEMMKALEVPWYARAAAAAFTPTLVISATGDALQVVSEQFFGSRTEQIHPDRIERPGQDILGRVFREMSHWTEAGGINTQRRLSLEDSEALITAIWHTHGDTLETTIDVALEDGSKIKVKRVFARLPGEG